MTYAAIWSVIHDRLRVEPAGTQLAYEKRSLPHPRAAGAYPSVGWPAGQLADFRFPSDSECSGLHVHEFDDNWVVHIDRAHPCCDLRAQHVDTDPASAIASGGALIGAAVGASIGKSAASTIIGGFVGLLAAALVLERSNLPNRKERNP